MRPLPALLMLLAFIVGSTQFARAETDSSAHTLDSTKVAPVTLDGEELFQLRGISALPARQRAARVHDNIVRVAEDVSIDPESGKLETREDGIAVVFGSYTIVTFFPSDAEIEGVRLKRVAEAALARLSDAIKDYRDARSTAHLLRSTGLLAGITVAAAILLWAMLALFRWLDHVLERRVKRKIQKLEQASHRVLDAGQIGSWLGGLLRGIRALSLFALAIAWLNTALGLYPWTSPLATQLFALVLEPIRAIGLGILASLPDLAFLAVLFVVIRFVLQAIYTFFDRVHRGWIRLQRFEPELALPTYRIVRVLVIVFALVIAYPYIPGSHTEAFKGMSIFFGVVLSIGSSSFIANIIAGYSLTYRRAFREGDRIKVGEQEGFVIQMQTLNTRIRSLKNEEINIPNSLVLGSPIINYTTYQRDPGLILHTEVGIGYDVPWRQVEAMLLEAAKRTAGLKREPVPFVLQKSLGDFTVVYQLNAYCDNAEQMGLQYSALHGHIQDVFNEYGVQIMSPNYVADPQQAKIVPPEQWYAAPAAPPAAEPG
jgi:small-conductance mechanosensitive channel